MSKERKPKPKPQQRSRYYSQLPSADLDCIAASFERELVPTTPLTPAMRRQNQRAKRKRGRPVVGEGAEKILITLERSLLRQADSFARKHHKNRSQLVAEALLAVMHDRPMRKAS